MIAVVVSLLFSYPVLLRQLKLSPLDYLAALWRPLCASIVMGLTVQAAMVWIGTDGSGLGALKQLAAGVPLGIVL